jgi:hypothetical protein
MPRALLLSLLLSACADDGAPRRQGPGEDFQWDDSVRITAPSNGEVVDPTFVVHYSAGADVAMVRLDVDGATQVAATEPGADGTGELLVSIEGGRHRLTLVGLDPDGAELSEHALSVQADDGVDPWVGFTSPQDGATVTNPVRFALSASDEVDTITVEADGWEIGEVEPGAILSYTFSGTGYAREVVATAWSEGVAVATDSLTITVDPGTAPLDSAFNDVVVELMDGYPTDGSYGYYWPSGSDWLGTTRDLWYLDTQVAEGDPQHRSYCVGLTWEVFLRAWEQVDAAVEGDGTVNGMGLSDLTEFRVDWFVRELYGDGVVSAVENYGIGEQITDWEDVRPGDFVQFWRHSGSGHNNIFVQWERDGDGEIEGLTYWSTQSSTDGISENTEYFGSSGSSIDPAYFFAARVYMPEDWIGW